ncbi:hypothetical protein Moror_9201 [Moniliophthora roreri MCA 2997]|uniref:F-box domain-containing protein n=1 Tax=Moniliophthora roreri (strain MCA 2997) TaxID=1381753 RepID=V2WXM5_MONRO|nr:hypothetical protein Moror_9201 [Moniliophthora roreri MCA 2997]
MPLLRSRTPYLPLEVISIIFENHPILSEVRECSLVCRSWVGFTREHGFRRIHIRSGVHLDELFRLYENEWQTLSYIKPKMVVLTNINTLDTDWQAQKLVEMFGGSICALRLEDRHPALHGVSRETLEFIQEWFAGVSRLEIARCYFPSATVYASFVRSFKSLKAFESIESWYRHSDDESRINMTRITDLALGSEVRGRPNMFHLFGGCAAVRNLRICPAPISSGSSSEVASVQRILREAGQNLEKLEIDINFASLDNTIVKGHYLFNSLDFSSNTNLRKLRLAIRFGDYNFGCIDYVLPFLWRLAASSVVSLEVLDLPFILDYRSLDWESLDRILQQPSFSTVKEVRCTGFVCCFTEKDCMPGGNYSIPSAISAPGKLAKELVDRLRVRLPRCWDRGILVVNVHYRLLSTPVFTEEEINEWLRECDIRWREYFKAQRHEKLRRKQQRRKDRGLASGRQMLS